MAKDRRSSNEVIQHGNKHSPRKPNPPPRRRPKLGARAVGMLPPGQSQMPMCRCQVVHPGPFLRPFLFCLGFPRSSRRTLDTVPSSLPLLPAETQLLVHASVLAPHSHNARRPRLLTGPLPLTHNSDAFGSGEISSLAFSARLLTCLAANPTILRISSLSPPSMYSILPATVDRCQPTCHHTLPTSVTVSPTPLASTPPPSAGPFPLVH
ncbi:hypothetical protein LX36DRAFT_78082 [Colletotrichum falcatum]|nr:hypothetical protein LX36DRAFT_78082 [Colletotrichum falcatum]